MHSGSSIPIYLADLNTQRLELLQSHLFRCGLFNIQLLASEEDCIRVSGAAPGIMIVHDGLLQLSISDFIRQLQGEQPDLYISFTTDILDGRKTEEAFHAGAFDYMKIAADTPRRIEKMIRCILRTLDTLNREPSNTTQRQPEI